MYLSQLLVNVGENPDRPRPGRLWLRNPYRVHQRLCMAFPSTERRRRDRDFLQPYDPADFGAKHVHDDRSGRTGFLFRVDPTPGGNPVILVQSACPPDWEYAFYNAQYLLAAPPQTTEFEPQFNPGQQLRFRLRVNPTVKKKRPGRKNGARVGVPRTGLVDWLSRKGSQGGFKLVSKEDDPERDPRWQLGTGLVQAWKCRSDDDEPSEKMSFVSATIDGILEVIEPSLLVSTVNAGVGPAKAFGFGLLSLAPA